MSDAAPADLPRIPPRPVDAHKGSLGRVLLLAGSQGMAGAAAMTALSTLRGGAGYVVVAAPRGIATALTVLAPSAVMCLCGDLRRERLGEADLPQLLPELARADVVACGPGLGRHTDTCALLLTVLRLAELRERHVPVLLDADALNLLVDAAVSLAETLPPGALLTPHPGEAARLLGLPGAEAVQADRPASLARLVERSAGTVLLKGAGTLVGAPGKPTWRNATGNPGMATAGSGDVLTGLIAALLARGLAAWDAARLGAWLHGRAGDLAATRLGEESLVATDLIDFLAQALREHPRAAC